MSVSVSSVVLTLVVAFAPLLTVFVVPRLIRAVGLFLGWTLTKKTEGRKAHLLALMDEENAKALGGEKELETNSTSSGEWQSVQDPASEGKSASFDGIIGFFHPFW